MSYKTNAWNNMRAQKQKHIRDAIEYLDKVAEREILKVITMTCDAALIPYMRNYNSLVVTTKAGERILARLPEHQKGKPDLTVLCRLGIVIWIETKCPSGVLSPDQLRWKEWILTRGHEYHAPRTVEEAHAVSDRVLKMGR